MIRTLTERETIALRLRQVHFPRPRNTTDEQQWSGIIDDVQRRWLRLADAIISMRDEPDYRAAFAASWGDDWASEEDYK